jgi:hypothetical protein
MNVVEERKTKRYQKFKEEVHERDGHQCRDCNSPSRLHVHHLIPIDDRPDLFYDITNAVTLCGDCHFKIHRCSDFKTNTGASYKKYLKITVKVIAEESGRCEETVRRHMRDGRIDLYSLDSIVRWINKNTVKCCKCGYNKTKAYKGYDNKYYCMKHLPGTITINNQKNA